MILQKVLSSRLVLQSIKRSNILIQPTKPTPNGLKLSSSIGFSTSARQGIRAGRQPRVNTTASNNTGSAIAIGTGQMAVAGASVLGLGALCYYGLGMSSKASTMDNAVLWPQYVKDRVRDTYMYFGGSLAVTAASCVAMSRVPAFMQLINRSGLMISLVSVAAMIGTSILCQSIPYKPGFGPKQWSWLLHTAVVGAVIAPMTVLGGPLMIRAAAYTAGIAGGISAVAMCAPSEKFLNWGGPLAAGFGVVFLANIGSAFLPPTNTLGVSLYSIAVYGGLVLFSAFLLYNTQRTIKRAETYPPPSPFNYTTIKPYDPVNACMSMYMDVVNIFMRIAILMANGNRKR